MAVIGSGPGPGPQHRRAEHRAVAARDGAKVLLIDADLKQRALSSKVSHFANS